MRNMSMKHSAWFTANTRVVRCVVIKDRNAAYLCHNDLRLPVSIFNACLIDAWDRSSNPIVWACFVVACFRVMPRTLALSLITRDIEAVLLSEINVVGKQACLVVMLIITLAIVLASWFDVG